MPLSFKLQISLQLTPSPFTKPSSTTTQTPRTVRCLLVSLEIWRFCTKMHTALLQVGKRTDQPLIIGGQRVWPTSNSDILRHWPLQWSPLPRLNLTSCQRLVNSDLRRPTPHRKYWTATNLSMDFHCCRCQTAHNRCRFLITLQPASGHGSQPSDWCLDSFTSTTEGVTTTVTSPSPTLLSKNPRTNLRRCCLVIQK